MKNKYQHFLFIYCLVALTGCSVGPDYQKPDLTLPSDWQQQNSQKPLAPDTGNSGQWWVDFHDPMIDKLVAVALENSTDRKIAAQKVLEARGAAQGALGALIPSVQGQVQASRSDQQQIFYKYPLVNSYQPALDASYELDLFGGNRRNLQASEANVEAQLAGYFDTTITLVAEVVSDYVQYRALQHQIGLSERTTEAQKQVYLLTLDKFKAGTGSRFDVAQAETQYKTTEARVPDYQRQLTLLEYQLEVLIGVMPNSVRQDIEAKQPMPVVEKFVVLDNPANVIARRPDVMNAERSLASATALQGVAISKLYPNVSISALFGYNETSIAPGSQIWSIGGNLVAPLFNFQSIEGQIDTADAQQKEAFQRYRHAVMQAIADVEGGLVSLKRERERNQFLAESVDAAQSAVTMARDRYRTGTATMTDVLQAEQQLYTTESDLITSKANLANDVVTLNKALGVGANPKDQVQAASWWLF